MLALVLVIGHFILTRLGIAYRAVTAFYSTGGKSICDDAGEQTNSDSYRKSRHKSTPVTGISSGSQAYMRSGVTSAPPPIDTQQGLPSSMTVQVSEQKKSRMTIPGTMQGSAAVTGYPGSTPMDPGLSKLLPPQDENCGPEISPSRMVTGPLPAECNDTAAWRQSRGRSMAFVEGEEETMATGYVGQERTTSAYVGQQRTMGTGYVGQDRTMGTGYVGQDRTMGTGYVSQNRTMATGYGGSGYPSQQRTGTGSAYYGGMSHHSAITGASAYEQSRVATIRGTRQSAALTTQSAGAMSEAGPTNGEMMKKLRVQFRPSKIPSAYRFPRPDDIPCSNEDYPPNAQEHGSGSRLTSYTTTTTPRASPPRSVSSQRPQTAFSRATAMQSGAYASAYPPEDINGVVSMQTGYQAQLGGVSGATGMYTGAETTGIMSMPQATSAIGYEQSQHTAYPSQAVTGYQTQAPSRMTTQPSAFSAVPPSQSAYVSGKSAYPMESTTASSRLTSVRSATTKNCKAIPAWSCGKPTGFDDGPLPRPPKRKAMSAADDFGVTSQAQSRTGTRRSQAMPGSETPSSTISPEIDFLTTSVSQMPQSASRSVAPTAVSRPSTPGSVMSTSARSHHSARSADMHVSGVPSSQKNKSRQHASGLYSVNASGIRSVSEQDIQQAVSQGAMTSAHYGTSLSRAGTMSPPQSAQRRSQRTAVLEMDCTNTDQYNDFN